MNSTTSSQTSQITIDTALLGMAIAAGQPAWPSQEIPKYIVRGTESSYSDISDQVINIDNQFPHLDFARDLASIYTSLSQRQERLGKEFETAIFDDLDSLYEA